MISLSTSDGKSGDKVKRKLPTTKTSQYEAK